MDFSDKQEHWIETGTAIGTGILAWEAATTAKFVPWNKANPPEGGYGLFSKRRFSDALGLTAGYEVAHSIFPDQPCAKGYGPNFNLFGAINKTSITGALILVADAVVKSIFPEYKKMDGLPSVVKGAGMGITAGGIIGGVFDPAPSGFTVLGQNETGGVATGNVPFGIAAAPQISVLQ